MNVEWRACLGVSDEYQKYYDAREHIALERADIANNFTAIEESIKSDSKLLDFYKFHVEKAIV